MLIQLFKIIVCICSVLATDWPRSNHEAVEIHKTRDGPEISFLNIDKVWEETNITGKNVVVAVVDNGLYYNHVDLNRNYRENISYDFFGNDSDPTPPRSSRHGTNCAGIIAAKRDGYCRTGVAYDAKLAGIRIFGNAKKDKNIMAKGLRHKRNQIDIYSNSWGPADNGYGIEGPSLEGQKSLKHGASQGRNGLGSIFVFSSGNGGYFGDSCAFDGYVNSIYTIAVSAVTKTGEIPRYAERCSAVITSTYGDEVKTSGEAYLIDCYGKFGRTSGAAAFASGIIALLLQANKNLTWRDVQHLIIRTSNPKKVKTDKDWVVNGAGLIVHPAAGFGVMDAKKLVDVAASWKNVQEQNTCYFQKTNQTTRITRDGATLRFPVGNNGSCLEINALEHVKVEVNLTSSYPRAYVLMYLISPEGTRSQLLYLRMFDAITQRREYRKLTITTLHFWGENPKAGNGEWRILLKPAISKTWQVKIHSLKLTFYGTNEDPLSQNTILPQGTSPCTKGSNKFWKGYKFRCCGSSGMYDPKHEKCCNGTNEVVENKNLLCGKKVYDNCEKQCCDGTLRLKFKEGEETHCCGKKLYRKSIHVCCGYVKKKKCKCDRSKTKCIEERQCLNGQFRDIPIEVDKPCPKRKNKNYGLP